MPTARDLIKTAMKKLGVYSIGEEPSDDEAEDGLNSLNSMLDSWATENLFVYAKTLDQIPLINGQTNVTVGPTGTFPTARPIKIDESSYILYQGVSYPLEVMSLTDYNEINLKTLDSGIPSMIWPLMNFPDITITPWPVPSASMTLMLWSNKIIKSFPDLTTSLDLPPGYQRAIEYSLAEEIAPDYEVEPSSTVIKKAAQARKNIKRINLEIPMMNMPYGIPTNGNNYYWQIM